MKKKTEQNPLALATAETSRPIIPFNPAATKTFEALGAVKALQAMSSFIGSQVILGLKAIEESSAYRDYGCENFADFLDRYSPLKRTAFYDRLRLLEKEGAAFDVLTQIGVSIRDRKLLGRGEVGIEGDEIIIKGERVNISEKDQIKTIIATLTQKVNDQDAKISKGEKTVKDLKTRLSDAEREARENSRRLATWEERLTEAQVSIGNLALALGAPDISIEDRREHARLILEGLGQQMVRVHRALGLDSDEDRQHHAIDELLADLDAEG